MNIIESAKLKQSLSEVEKKKLDEKLKSSMLPTMGNGNQFQCTEIKKVSFRFYRCHGHVGMAVASKTIKELGNVKCVPCAVALNQLAEVD